MKRYILKFYSVIALITLITSCNTDAEGTLYKSGNSDIAFFTTKMNVEVTAEDNGVVKVPVYRGNAAGTLSVDIELSGEEEAIKIFTLNSAVVNYADNENVAYAEIAFDLDKLGATDKYPLTLSVKKKELLSPSNVGEIAVVVSRQLTWEDYGTGIYRSEAFGLEKKQPIQKAAEGNIFRLPDCINDGYPLIFTLSNDGQEMLSWAIQPTGISHGTYGMIYYQAVSMTREGNTLTFSMKALVEYNGGWGSLGTFTEELVFPEN